MTQTSARAMAGPKIRVKITSSIDRNVAKRILADMRNVGFDTRLYRLFALLGGLMLIVGLLAIGVNRYLVRSHESTLDRALPVAATASRIQASADLAGSLTDEVLGAATPAELDRATAALDRVLTDIARDHALLTRDAAVPVTGPDGAELRDDLAAVRAQAAQAMALERARQDAFTTVMQAGEALSPLIAAQGDLARLRVTGTIADLHDRDGEADRRELDLLADRHFFAFERVGELARLIELMRITATQIETASDSESAQRASARLAAHLAEARLRVDYLPSGRARASLSEGLDVYAHALQPMGFAGLSRDSIAARQLLVHDLGGFRQHIARLQDAARAAQLLAQNDNLARIGADTRRAGRMLLMLMAAVVVALILAAVITYGARRRLLARMGHVTNRLVGIASGDFGAPLTITGQDEIGRLEKALNVLRGRAQEARDLRSGLEDAVRSRTAELVDEVQEAARARVEAEAANRQKSEFLARMSHEIRTPLNGVIGMLGLLEADEARPDERARLGTALASARDLVQITNDVLTLASAESGSDQTRPVHFRLRDLIGQVYGPLSALADGKGLTHSVDLADGAPPVLLGDVVKIRQVLTNLVSNAVKYTQRGGVALLVDHAPDPATGEPVLSFTVADTGIGMTRAQADRAFDAHSRADWARRAGVEGAGLGLRIAQRLTEAMGGALSLETAAGVGSRLTLTVPLRLGDPSQIDDDRSETRRFDADVLVVEDHPVNRMVVRGFLDRLGCRVVEAATAAEAVSALADDTAFDLALVDLDLPDRPGRDLIGDLRNARPGLRIAALTAHLIADTDANRADLAVDAVLTKPVSPRALADFLATAAWRHPVSTPPAATSASPAPGAGLDRDIAEIGTDAVQAIVAAFLDDLPGALDRICETNGAARSSAAHRLKGAASNFGLTGLCDLLTAVEAAPDKLDAAQLRDEAGTAATALRHAAAARGLQLS